VVAGRKPKPTALKKLNGNPGKRALNDKEPKPESAIPSCPAHVVGVGRVEWNRVTKELKKLNLITKVDRAALAAYCTAYKDYVDAEHALKKEGVVIISEKGGAYQNPWMPIKKRSMDQMVKFGAEFGLTPSSRARLRVETPTEEDEMANFLFGKKIKVAK